MRLMKFIKFIAGGTILSLVYIHMHLQIIDLAYKGKAKEKVIRKLVELNGSIMYSILTLKSSNNLGIKMLSEDSDMRFADSENIIQISTVGNIFQSELPLPSQEARNRVDSLIGLLSFGSQAEAKSR